MTSPLSWSDLPDECLALVLTQLQPPEVANARLVCSQWALTALCTCTSVHLRRPLTRPLAAYLQHELPRLRSLDIDLCTSVHHLHSLTLLTNLHIDAGAVPDFVPLSDLANLASISIEKSVCGDLEPLAVLTRLTSVELYRCSLSNIKPLSALTNLCIAKLHGNPAIRDIEPLSLLVRLTRLQLSQSGVHQATAICGLTALECLFLDRVPLAPDLSPLAKLTTLCHLAVSSAHGQQVDITPLAGLTRLHCLDLLDCKITNLRALSALTALRRLGLRKSRAADINAICNLTNLTSLDIRRSNFPDIQLLSGLRDLRLLVMSELGALSVDSLKGPTSVTVLRDDAGYLGCSFKHSNLKHMCDRHAKRAMAPNVVGTDYRSVL